MKNFHEISLSQNQLLLADSSALRSQLSVVQVCILFTLFIIQEEKKKLEESKAKAEEEVKKIFLELQSIASNHTSSLSLLVCILKLAVLTRVGSIRGV